MKLKSALYKGLKVSNDVNAIKKGKVGRRIGRRAAGKATGGLFKKIFG